MEEDFKSFLFIVATVYYMFDKNISSSFSNSVKLLKDKEEKMATVHLGPQRLCSHQSLQFSLMHLSNSKDEMSFCGAQMACQLELPYKALPWLAMSWFWHGLSKFTAMNILE